MNSAAQKLETNTPELALAVSTPAAQDLLETMPWLPCVLSLELPVVRFTVGDLLKLTKGSIVQTASHHTGDIPLRVNQLLIGWTEFEVVGDRLAVRITEQA